jgi:hypothetical protein
VVCCCCGRGARDYVWHGRELANLVARVGMMLGWLVRGQS